MDPLTVLGIVSNIVQLIDFTAKVVQYGFEVAEADKTILSVKKELESLHGLLETLHQRCEKAREKSKDETPAWLRGLWELRGRHFDKDGVWVPEYSGALFELDQAIREAMLKINPTKEWRNSQAYKTFRKATWPFRQRQLEEIRNTISSCLTRINTILALKDDEVLEEINDTVSAGNAYNRTQFTEVIDRLSLIEAKQTREEERRKQEEDEAETEEIVRWLSPFSFIAKQQELWTKSFKQVGEWLWQDERFQAWAEGSPWYLRCVGELGVGKTVLSSILGHRLIQMSEDPPPPVLSIYLDYKASKTQTVEHLVGSLLQQLIQLNESFVLPRELVLMHKKAKRLGYDPSSYSREIRKLLVDILSNFKRVFIIVDGFDELAPNERSELLEQLRNLKPGKVGLLLTSRGISEQTGTGHYTCDRCGKTHLKLAYHCQICNSGTFDICYECKQKGLCCDDTTHKLIEPYGEVEIKIKFPILDIENYVRQEIGAQAKLEGVEIDKRDVLVHENPTTTPFQDLIQRDTNLPAEIIEKVTQNAAGRFLYAKLYLDSLKTRTNLLMLEKALRTFPQDSDDIYREGLERIKLQEPDSRKRGSRILGMLARAKRPLLLEELKHALAVLTLVETLGDECTKENIFRAIDDTKSILGSTSSHVIVEEGHVRLVHSSLEEYLHRGQGKKSIPYAEVDLATACMTYLHFVLPSRPSEDDILITANAKFPFLQYAAQYWGDHIKPEQAEDMQDKVFRLMNDSARLNSCMQAAWVTNVGGYNTWDVWNGLDKLHICAWFGLSTIISMLSPETGTVDKVEPKYCQTPLMYACRKGHDEVAQQLLRLGASQRKVSARGRTALFEAILAHRRSKSNTEEISDTVSKHGQVVKVLVRDMPGDLDINMRHSQEHDRTALMLAAFQGQLEMIDILLEHEGIEVNLQDTNGMTALLHAARGGHYKVVKRLIDAEASMEIVDFQIGRSPLRCAAERNYAELVILLLNRGAKPNSKDREGGTAMLRAANRGAMNVLESVMKTDHHIDFACVDEAGQSLLHGAARNGYPEIARKLLERGLQVDMKDKYGRTPLSDASRCGHAAVVSALVEHKADVSSQDNFGRTASIVAWQYGKQDILRILPQPQQSLSTLNDKDLPIWALARQGLTDFLSLAITFRSQDLLNLEPCTGNTPLHCAIEANQPDILELLLQASNPPVNQANHWLRTPLHFAALLGDTFATSRLLSQKSIDLAPLDRWSSPPLVLAQSNYHPEVMLQLIKSGAPIPKREIDINEIFFFAVEQGDVEAVKVLLKNGVDRSVQNKEGKRAIAIAKAAEDAGMMRVLTAAPTVNLRRLNVTDADEEDEEEDKEEGKGRETFEMPMRAKSLFA